MFGFKKNKIREYLNGIKKKKKDNQMVHAIEKSLAEIEKYSFS
jgi:hypothetical protein